MTIWNRFPHVPLMLVAPLLMGVAPCLLIGVARCGAQTTPQSGAAQEDTAQKDTAQKDWTVSRANAEATGRVPQSLPESLELRWQFETSEVIEATPAVSGNRVIVADDVGTVYAIDRQRGTELWKRSYPDTGFLVSPAIQDGVIVIGDYLGTIYALDEKSGEELWRHEAEAEISGSASFHNDNVLVTSQDFKLYCLAVKDGKLQWTYETQDQIRCSPTVAGNRTFLGGCDGQLHVVNLDTGKAMGDPLPLAGPTGSTPAVQGNIAYLPIMDGVVYALDFEQNKQLWEHEDDERPQQYESSAAISNELVIVSSENRQVDALSIKTGKRKWRHTLRRAAKASPVIAGNDVWIASTDGRLIRLSLDDGTEKWSYEVRGGFLSAPAIAGQALFIADKDGVVRCFAAGS